MDFRSDNVSPLHPAILNALIAANDGPAAAYGADPWSARLEAQVRAVFEAPEALVLPLATGTAANALALSALTPPWGAILCHREAHVETDQCGAPEALTGGAKLVLIDGPEAKITPPALAEALTRNRRGVHSVAPRVLSLTQATERGAVYAPVEVAALAAAARAAGLRVHMDGARFANAIAHLGCAPADVTWRAGVDVLTYGATKNGAAAAEAIIAFDPALGEALARGRKRFGHLLCKQRYVAAQLLAGFEGGLWLELAGRANAHAQTLAAALGPRLSGPCAANAVFARLGEPALAALEAAGALFYRWGPEGSGEARFVTRWDHDPAEVAAFAALLARTAGAFG